MYKGWAIKSGPCTATFNDLLYFPLKAVKIDRVLFIFLKN
jgi:hypothetical protein